MHPSVSSVFPTPATTISAPVRYKQRESFWVNGKLRARHGNAQPHRVASAASNTAAAASHHLVISASDVTWEPRLVGQGSDPSGMTLMATPVARTFSAAVKGPKSPGLSDQSGRRPGK